MGAALEVGRLRQCALLVALGLLLPSAAFAVEPEIHTADVDRFYRLYEEAGGRPTAETLQRDYIDKGSPGLVHFARARNVTGARIAGQLEQKPAVYQDARACAAHLPQAKARAGEALRELGELYPQARFPPVYVVVGRGRPVGMGDSEGVYIGLESFCAWTTPDPDPEDRLVRLIVHEYVHVQQMEERPDDTVLHASLIEGAAEFLCELLTGAPSYRHLIVATRGREREIETEFVKDEDQLAQGSRWLYNGAGDGDRPGDLGYWVGYRIVTAYWTAASDKRAAIRDILEMRDAKTFLARSGWTPGWTSGAAAGGPADGSR